MGVLAGVRARSRTSWTAVVVDVVAAGAAAAAVLGPQPLGSAGPSPGALVVAVVTVAVVLTAHAGGLHRQRLVHSVVDDLPVLGAGAAVAVLATLLATLVATAGGLPAGAAAPRAGGLALLAAATFALGVVLRTLLHGGVRAARRLGRGARPTLVVGAGPVGRRLAESLLLRPDLGLRPVGLVDHGSGTDLRDLPLPLVGDVDDLDVAARGLLATDVVVAFPDVPDADLVEVVRRCLDAGHRVHVVPRLYELVGEGAGRRTDVVRGLPLVPLHPDRRGVARTTPSTARGGAGVGVASTAEALVSAAALVVLAPVLVLVAVAVRLETGAAPVVRRTRLGARGVEATLGFRILRPTDFGDDATAWRLDAGQQVGPVGRFVRATGLEELPRLADALRVRRPDAPDAWPLGPGGPAVHPPVQEPVRAAVDPDGTRDRSAEVAAGAGDRLSGGPRPA